MKKKKIIIIAIFLIICLIFLIIPKKKIEASTEQIEENVVKTEEKIEDKKIEEIKKAEIKGKVKNPGVYEIKDNERVIDLIEKAGGLIDNANTNVINLSKKLKDEMVVIIYSTEEIEENNKKYEKITIKCTCPDNHNEACIEENETKENNDLKVININEASIEDLMTLPSIGEAQALKIVEYRENNKFETIDDIKNVSGIGEALFEKIKEYITV